MVKNPGPGVLQVRVAITDILKGGKIGSATGIVEAEFIDTQTNERVAAALTLNEGMVLDEWARLLRNRLKYLHSETKIYQFE